MKVFQLMRARGLVCHSSNALLFCKYSSFAPFSYSNETDEVGAGSITVRLFFILQSSPLPPNFQPNPPRLVAKLVSQHSKNLLNRPSFLANPCMHLYYRACLHVCEYVCVRASALICGFGGAGVLVHAAAWINESQVSDNNNECK